jgi:hypothetical protein
MIGPKENIGNITQRIKIPKNHVKNDYKYFKFHTDKYKDSMMRIIIRIKIIYESQSLFCISK